MKFIFPMPGASRVTAVVQPWELHVTGADQTRMAQRADELGYDMIRIPEHFVIPRAHVELSGAHYFHSAAAQGYFLGATRRIRIGTSVAILPLQHPIVTAKALSTIDWLSGGRTTAAFGVGWLKGEFDALGVPFERRGRMADEYLAAIIELWTKDLASFRGEYISFEEMAFEPKPIQEPHIPIWIGGDSDAALRRAARFASGWAPFLTKPDDFPARIDFIKSQPSYGGSPLEIMYNLASAFIGEGHLPRHATWGKTTLPLGEMVDLLGWLKDRGVTIASCVIPPVKDVEAYLDYAQWFIEEVKPRLQGQSRSPVA